MNTKSFSILFFLLFALCSSAWAQNTTLDKNDVEDLQKYFQKYKAKGVDFPKAPQMMSYSINNPSQTITITVSDVFGGQEFSPDVVNKIYKKVGKILSKPYNKYKIIVKTTGVPIEDLIPNRLSNNADGSRLWGKIDYKGIPWVQNISKPNAITHGLNNRHLSLWSSHGRYYDQKKGTWRWQRPNLFCTNEDLYTQTIVVPYLIPMLENAGAVVFTPRERDWQKREIIIDYEHSRASGSYQEYNGGAAWRNSGYAGFALHNGTYRDKENPFEAGGSRMVNATSKVKQLSQVSYQPTITEEGKYAVYVSYTTVQNSVPDAQYVVFHKGQQTHIRVNQQMGGGTWVYLGTFEFDKGNNNNNRVVLTNYSQYKGVITTDAVRFGGGMGNIQRGGKVSGLPRTLEGARYYCQWAGAPYSVYSSKNGADDYADDINARSYMTNWLAGGSCYVPSLSGKRVPIELSLAVHSDAGFSPEDQLIGSLSICTTNTGNGKLNSGVSRMASYDFAESLLSGLNRDLRYKYGNWIRRDLYNRNYSETRCPEMPSAIIETLSHQNFPDMRFGQDPNFRFTLARSLYKTILRYISNQHGSSYVVQPLAPNNFRIEFTSKNRIRLSWNPVYDAQEPTSSPTAYNLYIAVGSRGFDNGQTIKSNSCVVDLQPGVQYNFRVTAVNRGGESFPTEVLSAYYQPNARQTVLIVNGFHRLSSPAIINTTTSQGFDMNADPGVTYGSTAGWSGKQLSFDKTKMGIEGAGGLGYCGDEMAGMFIAGNDFNYVKTHAEAIASAGKYNIVSCSSEAIKNHHVKLSHYDCIDLLLGLERNDGHSLVPYKTFTGEIQQELRNYVRNHGNLLVSGAYIGADMQSDSERQFLANTLKVLYAGSLYKNSTIRGLGTNFSIYSNLNEKHYAATTTDVLRPSVNTAFCAMQYSDGNAAGVAYNGRDYHSFVMGFPFECIIDPALRNSIMRGILNFLIN